MRYLIKKNQIPINMNKKLKIKIALVLGTRPEIIRLSEVIKKLKKNVNLILIHTNQNYDYNLNNIFFKDLDLPKPNYFFDLKRKKLSDQISEILVNTEKVLLKEKPDAFVVLGDTNSALSAYVAKRLKIPIFHIEAGNRSYDPNVPEEINRKIVDHLSDINIVYSALAKENLIRENFGLDRIFHLGSPLYEVYKKNTKLISNSKILKKLNITKDNYILVSIHRDENLEIKNNFTKVLKLLDFLNKKKEKIIFSTHPRTQKKIKKKYKNIFFHKPFSYSEYNLLQINAKIVLSDSGSLTEESSILKLKSINLRSTYERQEGMKKGISPMINFDINKIQNMMDYYERSSRSLEELDEYKAPSFSDNFYKILISYVDYVNKYLWYK